MGSFHIRSASDRDDPPPGQQHRIWPPISSTLIAGRNSAVLVDAPITTTQAGALADRVAATGKSLTGIYIIHGHPDHWFGASVLLDRFPDARMVAMPVVVHQMRRYLAPQALSLWRRRFPGQIPANPTVAAELGPQGIELEGHQLTPVAPGHTDMDDTTCLHVASARLVAAGDAVYNGVYPQLRESSAATRREWIAALDTIESLRPAVVVAGHKRPGATDGPENIDVTRTYIRSFEKALAEEGTAAGVYKAMVSGYPDRLFPGALWASACSLRTQTGASRRIVTKRGWPVSNCQRVRRFEAPPGSVKVTASQAGGLFGLLDASLPPGGGPKADGVHGSAERQTICHPLAPPGKGRKLRKARQTRTGMHVAQRELKGGRCGNL
jgi:glyoxylase-like metal-dependent hydrolase (beta-lactamase superfamily II)